jgi:hypothetical protein
MSSAAFQGILGGPDIRVSYVVSCKPPVAQVEVGGGRWVGGGASPLTTKLFVENQNKGYYYPLIRSSSTRTRYQYW